MPNPLAEALHEDFMDEWAGAFQELLHVAFDAEEKGRVAELYLAAFNLAAVERAWADLGCSPPVAEMYVLLVPLYQAALRYGQMYTQGIDDSAHLLEVARGYTTRPA